MINPMISVIMSVYNDEKYLSKSIESILNQTYKNFEFIVINDGSIDESLDIIKKYSNIDKRIVVVNQNNIGLTKSLNKAIKLSKGKYIARQDSDDVSELDRFEKQIGFLENNSDYALVGTNISKIDKDDKLIEINSTKYSNEDIVKTFKKRNCIAHGSVMINKKLVGDKLYYDEEFEYAQDFRLWTKIATSFKIINLEEPLYKLRIHTNSISKQKIEKQSIYAGIVAYEFEQESKIYNIDEEVLSNIKLREKIGMILLMNLEPKMAMKYFLKSNKNYWIGFIFKYIDLNKLKNIIKKFI